jgi:uncharacterized protein YqjF (DUF2071 family)
MRPLVPAALDLDLWDGRAYAGIVAFAMEAVRPLGLPPELGMNFLETNVRTYVRWRGGDPGVYFFSLDAASVSAVVGARVLFNLPYFPASMHMEHAPEAIKYRSVRWLGGPASLSVRYRPGGALGAAPAGSHEHFLAERYCLYTRHAGFMWRIGVRHSPYPLQLAEVDTLDESLLCAAGLPPPASPPDLVHYSPGVDTRILWPERL